MFKGDMGLRDARTVKRQDDLAYREASSITGENVKTRVKRHRPRFTEIARLLGRDGCISQTRPTGGQPALTDCGLDNARNGVRGC